MAIRTNPIARENDPLLAHHSSREVADDDASSETFTESQGGEDEGPVDLNKANQQVGAMRGLFIGLSLWGLIFLQASNMSGITTTQSKIAEDFDAFASVSWLTSTYMIAASSTSPLAARLAQIFSPRYCILGASILFSFGGAITAHSPSLGWFLLGRGLSGVAASGIMTISLILILELSIKKRRGLFIGLMNTGFTLGVSLGAVIAGALLDVTGWRFLFWVQIPLALVAGTGLFFSIPKSFTSGQKGVGHLSITQKLAKIDYLGATLLTISLCLFLFALSWPKILWIPIAISPVLLIAFVFVELYIATDPIIPIPVLKSRGALLSCLAQLGIMSARWMVLFYTPAYAIAILSWSPASAGSILIPTNAGFSLGGILAGWLHIRRVGSFWLASIVSYSAFALTLFLLSQISKPTTPPPLYFFAVFLNGICTGAALNYTLAHLLHLTTPSNHFISLSLLTTFRGFAGSFGSAIGGGIFARVLKTTLESEFSSHGGLEGRGNLIRKLLGSPALVKSLEGVEREAAVKGYVVGFRALFMTSAGLAMAMVLVQAGTGWTAPVKKKKAEVEGPVAGNGRGFEDEEWEEGMEAGI